MTTEEMTDPFEAEEFSAYTEVRGPVGAVVTGHEVNLSQTFNSFYERALATARSLDAHRNARMFVEPDGWGDALAAFRNRGVAALMAAPGTGRHIAAVNLLLQAGTDPMEVTVDPDDLDRRLPAEPGHGYLVDLTGIAGPALTPVLEDYLHTLRSVGASLVLIGSEDTRRVIDLDWEVMCARLAPPDGRTVFARRLTGDRPGWDQGHTDEWLARPEIEAILSTAAPADAVRLAHLVGQTAPDAAVLVDVLGAYHNWHDELQAWFAETEDAEDRAARRALLIAVAALEGLPADLVLVAADRLLAELQLRPSPGDALHGLGSRARIAAVGAHVRGGRIHFDRPHYGRAVLDMVWEDRFPLRRPLRRWFASLPMTFQDPETASVAVPLLELAVRQGDEALITKAAQRWAGTFRRSLAVDVLTVAAVSDELGRRTRQRLYDWATTTSAGDSVHVMVAEVCGGRLADVYPSVALTRLRHLARRESGVVQEAVIRALTQMAARPPLTRTVLREIAEWMDSYQPQLALAGRRAFLAIARPDGIGRIPILDPSVVVATVLSAGWHRILRDHALQAEADPVATAWLEAAATGTAPPGLVIRVLAGACGSSKDLAALVRTAWAWSQSGAEGAPPAVRERFRNEVVEALLERGRLDVAPVRGHYGSADAIHEG